MKESQTVGSDINSFFSVKILYCTLAGPLMTDFVYRKFVAWIQTDPFVYYGNSRSKIWIL